MSAIATSDDGRRAALAGRLPAPDPRSARGLAVLGLVGASIAGLGWLFFSTNQITPLLGYHLDAWVFVAAGLVAWARRPTNRTGPLLTLAGLLLGVLTLQGSHLALPFTLGMLLDSSFAPLLFIVMFAFPGDRIASGFDRLLIAISVAIVVVQDPVITLFTDPAARGCGICPRNLALVTSRPELVDALHHAVNLAVIVFGLGLFVPRLMHRWLRASSPARRTIGPLLLSTAVWLGAHASYRVILEFIDTAWVEPGWLTSINQVVLGSIPLAYLFGTYRARARRSRVGDLVVELGAVRTPERLRSALARALGDPTVEVGFWVDAEQRYVTSQGTALPDDPGDGRVATFLESKQEPLAVILHDAALLDDPRLIEASGAATRLAVENERLEAIVRAQLEEVRASRARIVEAGDAERRRLERDLHDGAQQRLIRLALQLRMLADAVGPDAAPEVRDMIGKAADEARAAHAEIRDLAQGVHPSILSDQGLGPALEDLAERAALPVTVRASGARFPQTVEATAYFVAAEALANVTKHARASAAVIEVDENADGVLVSITDDGAGGADATGGGLRGLADRVAALDGRFRVESPSGGGTRIVAEIPCA